MKCRKTLFLMLFAFAVLPRAHGSATLLLEEPFGHFGALTATGHAAVYLPKICAATPTWLRPCDAGESGIVISRYNGISGRDWIAIPLIPYLYAVESAEDVPLFANPKLVAFLRNQYRRKHLQSLVTDTENGEPPTGNWVQLTGAAFDRTIYSYEIETTQQQDQALIAALNARPNRSRFRLLSRNCADFARGIVDFYYPRAVHRNIIADLGITTPKQLARTLVKFEKHHPYLKTSSFVIPQVPGSSPRSTPIYGVLESFLKSKKYVIPLAAFHPIIMGGVAIAYLGSGRFDPAKHALVMDSSNKLRPAIDPARRRTYEEQLNALLPRSNPGTPPTVTDKSKTWSQLQAKAEPRLDSDGRPVLEMRVGEKVVEVGISRENILATPEPAVTQQLVAYRLRDELRRSAAQKTSEADVLKDWELLNQVAPAKSSN